ncbi:MAG: hypothetical protein ACYC61_03230 [Isosphaeraceae bacterium]
MKPPVKVEPMFAGDERRRIRPLVALGVLAIVLASGALALQAQSIDEQDDHQTPLVPVPVPRNRDERRFERSLPPGTVRPPVAARPRDRFEVVARADLDAKMAVKAPSELDAAMVIDPETRRRHGRAPGRPSPGPGPSRSVRVPSSLPNPGSR